MRGSKITRARGYHRTGARRRTRSKEKTEPSPEGEPPGRTRSKEKTEPSPPSGEEKEGRRERKRKFMSKIVEHCGVLWNVVESS